MNPGNRRAQVGNEDRLRIINCFEEGDDWVELAHRMNIKRETARSIIRVWADQGRMEKLARGGATRIKMDNEMKDRLLEIIDQFPFVTLDGINQKLRQALPNKPNVSTATVARTLDGQLITCKIAGKDADVPAERNRPVTIDRRREYAQFFYTTWCQ